MAIEATKATRIDYSPKFDSTARPPPKKNKASESSSLDTFAKARQRDEVNYEKTQGRGAGRKKPKEAPPSTTPPISTPPPPISVEPTKPTEPSKDTRTYAEKYVALYEQNSGRTLSSEERAAKVENVAQFYSEPSRANRLETLVDGLSVAA